MTTPFGVNPFVDVGEAHRGRVEQTRENSARQAWSYASLATHGIGEVQHLTVVPFDCTFIELPKVSSGFYIDGDLLIDGQFPTVTAGIWKWQQDRRGYYVGAYVFFVLGGDANMDLVHDFTFSGVAIKDLPDYLMDD